MTERDNHLLQAVREASRPVVRQSLKEAFARQDAELARAKDIYVDPLYIATRDASRTMIRRTLEKVLPPVSNRE